MFRRVIFHVALALIAPIGAFAQPQQTFSSSSGGLIPDNITWAYFPLNVSGLNQTNIDTLWGFEKITLTIMHTWVSDLEVWLGSPDSTEVLLFSGVGGDGDNFINTAFKKNYTTPIGSGSAPFTGNYKPVGDLGLFNNGQNGNGVWYLKILDTYPADQGNLVSWSIRFGNAPAKPEQPFTGNLPIIKINTFGASIPDDPKIAADFFIINNPTGVNKSTDTTYAYRGRIGIEQRGSSSAWAPKKSYGFETWNPLNVEIDTSLLGLPSESDWILSASYFDKTLMRNVLAYHIANRAGHYASRTRYCELIINNQYQGVYILMEKIKRDKNRVNIAKLTPADTVGDALTGGYILKIDKFTGSGGDGFTSNYPPSNPTGDQIFYQYEYPNSDALQPEQKTYIKNYIDSFETALFGISFKDTADGFRKFADEKSFMDYMFLNEASKNVDGYRLSTFLHKDKVSNGGKIKMGPAWDYDIAFFNADYCQAFIDTGWAYNFNFICPGSGVPAWWARLRQDSLFNQRARCRWNFLRSNVLHLDTLYAFIDSMAAYIHTAQQRNFALWNIIGVATWPQPTPLPQSYAEEILRLKQWLQKRMTWLDNQINKSSIYHIPVTLGTDSTFCSGDTLQLNPGNFETYRWNTGDTTATLNVFNSGNYYVTVSDRFNCTGSGSILVDELPLPDATFTTTFLNAYTVQFNGIDTINTSAWYFGDGSSSTSANPVHEYAAANAIYSVTHQVTDSNGCTATFTDTILVQYTGAESMKLTSVSVFPNPAENQITLVASQPIELVSVNDVSGRAYGQVSAGKRQEITLSAVQWPSGVYFITIKLPHTTLTQRVLKRP